MAVGELQRPTDNELIYINYFEVLRHWAGPLASPQPILTNKDYSRTLTTVFSSLDDCISHLDSVSDVIKYRKSISDYAVKDIESSRSYSIVELYGNSVILEGNFKNVGYILSNRFNAIVAELDKLTPEDYDLYNSYYLRNCGYILHDALTLAEILIERKDL